MIDRNHVPKALARSATPLITGRLTVAHNRETDLYHARARTRRGVDVEAVGQTAAAAVEHLIQSLKGRRRIGAARSRLRRDAEQTMARLGIPSDPIPPRCTPENLCPQEDDRHVALYGECLYRKDPLT